MKTINEYLHWYFDVEDLERDQDWGMSGEQTLDLKNDYPLLEPETILLLGLGLLGVAVLGQKRSKKLLEDRKRTQRVGVSKGKNFPG